MRAWDGKRILVTGGAGFIGSHLVDNLLSEGVEHVAVVDNFFLGKESNLSQATKKYKDKVKIYREDAAEFSSMEAVCGKEKPDVVFNALHGQFGEDGYVQAILETQKIPYTHSGVISSSIAMDKVISKNN